MSRDVRLLAAGVRDGDRRALAQAITLVESDRDVDLDLAQELLQAVDHGDRRARRIGITGVPGVGKSTFIDAVGTRLTARGETVAVLAVDPSSSLSGGSILGDKTRMEHLSRDPRAFIRPSPGGRALGGVGHHTREAMLLCEAAGFHTVMVETIGVGQSEISVAEMVDTFVLLMLAGAGDELQGIKRGIMELADVLAIHKADGDNVAPAELAARDYANALQLLPSRHAAWRPAVVTCSSQTGAGLDRVLEAIEAHRSALGEEGLDQLRNEQALSWFELTLREMLVRQFLRREDVAAALPAARERVRTGLEQPTAAVLRLLRTEHTGPADA